MARKQKTRQEAAQKEYAKWFRNLYNRGVFGMYGYRDEPDPLEAQGFSEETEEELRELVRKMEIPLDPKNEDLRAAVDTTYFNLSDYHHQDMVRLFGATGISLTEDKAQKLYHHFICQESTKWILHSMPRTDIWAAVRLREHCGGPLPKQTKKIIQELERRKEELEEFKEGEEDNSITTYWDGTKEDLDETYRIFQNFLNGRRNLIPEDILKYYLYPNTGVFIPHRDGQMEKRYNVLSETNFTFPCLSELPERDRSSAVKSLIARLDSLKRNFSGVIERETLLQRVIDSYRDKVTCNLEYDYVSLKISDPWSYNISLEFVCKDIREPHDLNTIIQLDKEYQEELNRLVASESKE